MNKIYFKKIVAREWLIFLSALIIGIIFSDIAYFMNASEYIIPRGNLYQSLRYRYQENQSQIVIPRKELDKILDKNNPFDKFDKRKSDKKFNPSTARPLQETEKINSNSFISYSEFNKILNDNSRRKQFYDSITATDYDLGDFNTFENEITKPTFYSGLLKLFEHLFSKWFWLSTLFSILFFYILLQFIRSIYFSIRLLVKNHSDGVN